MLGSLSLAAFILSTNVGGRENKISHRFTLFRVLATHMALKDVFFCSLTTSSSTRLKANKRSRSRSFGRCSSSRSQKGCRTSAWVSSIPNLVLTYSPQIPGSADPKSFILCLETTRFLVDCGYTYKILVHFAHPNPSLTQNGWVRWPYACFPKT